MTTTILTSASPCPKCGGALKCYDRDVGPGYQEIDEYSLVCPICGLIDRETITDYENFTEADWESSRLRNKCPFCDGPPGSHESIS